MILDNCASHLHLAAIYSEATPDERSTFAHIKLDSGLLTEDKLDWLLDQFLGTNGLVTELLNETIAKSK
jgi:hypothetical protein